MRNLPDGLAAKSREHADVGCGAWNGADVLVEALLANASDAIAVSDRESGRYVMASDSYCRLTGYAREELIGRTSVELGLIASYAARSEGLDRAIRGTRGVHELHLRRKDGAIRVLEFSVTLLAGGPLMLSVSRDVTERRALEAQLRASELRLRAAVESMPDAFSIASAVRDVHGEIVDFRWQYVNNAYCALVGFDRDQLLQRRGSELFAEFPSSERFAIYRRAAITGEPCQIVTTLSPGAQRAGAPARLVEYSVAAIGGDIAVWGRDITERHSAEAKLAASEQRFRVAVESMLDAFTIISAVRDDQGEIVDFRYEYVNEAYCRLIGSDREQILGRRGTELMAAFTDSKRFETYRQVVITGEPCRIEDVVQAAAPAGAALAARLIDINIVAMGENLVVLGRDVTERRDAERRIRELNKTLDRRALELEAANRELESFAYSVAHDLRTPLRAIAGFSDLLRRAGHIRDDDDSGQALIGRTTAAARRMGELIDALLELAQLSRCELVIAPVDLSAVAREIADQLRSSDEPRDVDFVIEAGLQASGDLRLARVLLRSLLENAWKYSGGCERARIEVARAGPGLFAVRDNGAGFDMEFAEQLFKPFGRLHRQDEFPGTGVGLATAERIVQRHGGTLKGEGWVGQGATFYFSLEPEKGSRR